MSRIFITGSTDGLGKAVATQLIQDGHHVILHARHAARSQDVASLTEQGAGMVIGDLSDLAQTKNIAESVNRTGPVDVVIHNAGVGSGPDVFAVNVVAPYLLSALLARPSRMIYLSSSMHFDGRACQPGEDWGAYLSRVNYSDSKLLVTTLACALARLWPNMVVSSVDPGWVATKMGGASAPDDFQKGYETQAWLATSTDSSAIHSGGYWHYKQLSEPHAATQDRAFQEALLQQLQQLTGVSVR